LPGAAVEVAIVDEFGLLLPREPEENEENDENDTQGS
jgi:hypothetical protein